MLLADLADVARSSGLPVVEVPGWQTRGHGQMSGVRTIVCHHTAGPASGDMPSLAVVRDGRPGLAGPLAQMALARSGTVYVVAAGLAYHAGVTFSADQGNAWSVGIEAEATGTAAWPVFQWNAYARLCAALCRRYSLPPGRVLGHKEVASPAGRKTDPNFDMTTFRAAVAAALGEEIDMTPEQAAKLDRIYGELTTFLANRRGDGSAVKDTTLGYASNADGFGFRNEVALRQLGGQVGEIKAAMTKLAVGTVDYQVLAAAVVDELHKRTES